MSENPLNLTKRLIVFGTAVLLMAWAIMTAVNFIMSVWWQLLIIVAVVAVVVVGITTWRSRR